MEDKELPTLNKRTLRKSLFVTIGVAFVAIVLLTGGLFKRTTDAKYEGKIAERIVCLSPASTEICFAIGAGDKVVAVTSYCDYPAAAKELPVVGGFDGSTISIESILSFEPDLVYLTDGMHNFLIPQLESLDVDYILSTANSIDGIEEEIVLAGMKTDHLKEADKVVKEMMNVVKSAVKKGENPVPVYWEVWNAPYMSAGPATFIGDVITTCGGKNIFDDCTDAYPIVSEELIITREPEIILIPQSSGVTAEMVAKRAGWENIPAVKNGKIFIVDDNVYTRPGPRISDAIKELSNIVQGK